jgi:hypothetical protein
MEGRYQKIIFHSPFFQENMYSSRGKHKMSLRRTDFRMLDPTSGSKEELQMMLKVDPKRRS